MTPAVTVLHHTDLHATQIVLTLLALHRGPASDGATQFKHGHDLVQAVRDVLCPV
jgi:hypothetical protein